MGGHLDRDIPGFDQEFEDMEDEFEEARSLITDDFDEHADDMEDLEDLTPEEAEDREAILDDREGRLAGPIVRCGRWTNRVVELDGNTTGTRCTARKGTLSSQNRPPRTTPWSSRASGANARDHQKTSQRRASDVLYLVNRHSSSSSIVLLVFP